MKYLHELTIYFDETFSIVLGLKSGELEWLGNHLGHTVDIHKESYRLHENAIEMVKVSKILLAIECGITGNLKGKTLDEIQLDGKYKSPVSFS